MHDLKNSHRDLQTDVEYNHLYGNSVLKIMQEKQTKKKYNFEEKM